MKRFSKSKKISTLLGAGLLMLTACAPDSLTRGGAAQPAPIERSTDDGAASNANEANVQAAPGVSAPAQAATSASSSSPLSPTLQSTPRARGEIEFTGTVEVIASDTWVVGGRTLAVTTATEIKPGLTIGMLAKVHVIPQANGTLWAREIEPTLGIDNSNSNSNDNSNSNGNSNVNDNANSNSNANSNGNVNSNDDNGNDDHSSNSNDNNSNDDHGGNSNDDNGNDDHGGNSNDDNSNDDHGGNSNDDNGNNDDNDNGNSNVD